MTELKQFHPSEKWIAKKLGIDEQAVRTAISDLELLELLTRENGTWKKTTNFLSFPTKRTSATIRSYHRTMIEKALHHLESSKKQDFESRDISGSLIPVDPEKIPEAKKRIERFRKNLIRFLSEGDSTQLYHLNVQLFPLTSVERARKDKEPLQ